MAQLTDGQSILHVLPISSILCHLLEARCGLLLKGWILLAAPAGDPLVCNAISVDLVLPATARIVAGDGADLPEVGDLGLREELDLLHDRGVETQIFVTHLEGRDRRRHLLLAKKLRVQACRDLPRPEGAFPDCLAPAMAVVERDVDVPRVTGGEHDPHVWEGAEIATPVLVENLLHPHLRHHLLELGQQLFAKGTEEEGAFDPAPPAGERDKVDAVACQRLPFTGTWHEEVVGKVRLVEDERVRDAGQEFAQEGRAGSPQGRDIDQGFAHRCLAGSRSRVAQVSPMTSILPEAS